MAFGEKERSRDIVETELDLLAVENPVLFEQLQMSEDSVTRPDMDDRD